MPFFVHEEFERYLCCGRLEEGFVRVACSGGRHRVHALWNEFMLGAWLEHVARSGAQLGGR